MDCVEVFYETVVVVVDSAVVTTPSLKKYQPSVTNNHIGTSVCLSVT